MSSGLPIAEYIHNGPRAPVSVIMPTWNQRPEWLRMAIMSVAAQSMPPEELIIVTAAGDSNIGLLNNLAHEMGSRLALYEAEKPSAHGQWKLGMQHASAKYVTKADSDDFLMPFKLEHEMGMLRRKPEAVVAFTGFWYADGLLRPGGRFSLESYAHGMLERGCVVTESALVDREVWKGIGFLDLQYSFASFWDSVLKISEQHPGGFVYDPVPSWCYRHHEAQVSAKEVPTSESQNLRWKVVKEHFLRVGRTLPDWEISVKPPAMGDV